MDIQLLNKQGKWNVKYKIDEWIAYRIYLLYFGD